MACSRKSGVVSTRTTWPSYSSMIEGHDRLSCGSVEWHTAQSQPIVGTPIDVPLPSTVSLAFIEPSDCSSIQEDSVAVVPANSSLLHKPYAARRDSSAGNVPRPP